MAGLVSCPQLSLYALSAGDRLFNDFVVLAGIAIALFIAAWVIKGFRKLASGLVD